jgi:hypothetical protein
MLLHEGRLVLLAPVEQLTATRLNLPILFAFSVCVPRMVLLINPCASTELAEQYIQSRFSCRRLVSAIRYVYMVWSDDRDRRSVQDYIHAIYRLLRVGEMSTNNFRVGASPVTFVTDCIQHLLFNLSHDCVPLVLLLGFSRSVCDTDLYVCYTFLGTDLERFGNP